MPISYTYSNFREKQQVNGHNPAKQAHKIWRKNFKGLLSYRILDVGSFFAAPCRRKAVEFIRVYSVYEVWTWELESHLSSLLLLLLLLLSLFDSYILTIIPTKGSGGRTGSRDMPIAPTFQKYPFRPRFAYKNTLRVRQRQDNTLTDTTVQ